MHNNALCWRCEHRAVFHEQKIQSRYECGQNMAVGSCYMFQPVKPVILKRSKGDKRPLFAGWGIAARVERSKKETNAELTAQKESGGYLLWWKPKT